MKISSRLVLIAVLAVINMSRPAYSQEVGAYKILAQYFADVLPGERFLPTPYGADARFKPKSIWIFLNNLSGDTSKKKKKNGWIIASAGTAIYDDIRVPVSEREISLPTVDLDKTKSWSIGLSLMGKVELGELKAGIDAASKKNITVTIELPQVMIEHVHYYDMILAQEVNERRLEQLDQLIRKSEGGEALARKVITASLKVRDAKVTIERNAESELGASVSADLTALLAAFGLAGKRLKEFNGTYEIQLDGWKYLAYQSLVTDSEGLISKSGGGVNLPEKFVYPHQTIIENKW